MPRISAPSIAEHVRAQEDAILGAAARLFAERGVAGTDLSDIAEAVGLARPSLYRYFPDKDHILLRWFEREMEPVQQASEELLASDAPAGDRLHTWLDEQLTFVADPGHELAPRIMEEIGAVSPDVRAAIAAGHARLYGMLADLLGELLAGTDHDAEVALRLVSGLVDAAGRALIDGVPIDRVAPELHGAVDAILA